MSGESLALPAAIGIVETMLGESYDKELKKIPLADNNVRGISIYFRRPL